MKGPLREPPPQFEAVLLEFQDPVFRLCCAMLGDQSRAEEVAQEIFIRIWKALPRYRGESSLSTWIYSIARNACRTALKRNRMRTYSLDLPGIQSAVNRVAGQSERPDPRVDILRSVAALPEQYRQVILLYHMEEHSYEEVSAMLDLPLGTVKTYLHRARKQLAEAIGSDKLKASEVR